MKYAMWCALYVILLSGTWSCSRESDKSDQGASDSDVTEFVIDIHNEFQTIHNFGASDAWSIQFVGKNWPEEKKAKIAELLFSKENGSDGTPKGIGLSAWRFNIGAGSAEQGNDSQINDEWRRAECFLDADGNYDWAKQEGQQWFLKAAGEYGVDDFIAFVNSPPVAMTKNGKAWSDNGESANLEEKNHNAYAEFIVECITGLKNQTGVDIDYISPFNEPQWEWKCCGQEGSPWNNDEIRKAVVAIDQQLQKSQLTNIKMEVTEAGQIDFLYSDAKSPNNRDNQIVEFFNPTSVNYLGNLNSVAQKIAAHSYFTTYDVQHLINTRKEVHQKIKSVSPDLEYWMTEYTILENNDEIKGNGRDLGIVPAIYMARVIQADLLFAQASAWHWWLAVSPYDYKDGLVYIDMDKDNGNVYESKMLWALGNFSRFIRPGSERIEIGRKDGTSVEESLYGIISSAYSTPDDEIIVVFTNQRKVDEKIRISGLEDAKVATYVTSAAVDDNLRYEGESDLDEVIILPGKSIVTCVIK